MPFTMSSRLQSAVPWSSLFLLIFWMLNGALRAQALPGQKPGVSILSHTGNDIVLHCKSAQDDLGEKTIPYNQIYHWNFRANLGLTTMWWCKFRWLNPENKVTYYAAFEVWGPRVIREYAIAQAAWRVEKDGFHYFATNKNRWETWEYWNTTPPATVHD